MIRSRENNADKRPFALFNSLPLIPSIRNYYGKTKHSNFLIERSCNLAEATVRPLYKISEPTLQRLDEFANDKVHKSLSLAYNVTNSVIKTAVWPAGFAYGYASHGLDLVADTPVGHVVEGTYDIVDDVIDNILPASDAERQRLEEDHTSSVLDKKSPIRRVYRRISPQALVLVPGRTLRYSKQLSYSLGDRALSNALDISALLVNRSYYISTSLASAIITATPGSKFVVEKIGAHLVPSERLANNLQVVLGGVLDQLNVWHRRAQKAHMKQTVELINTVSAIMKTLQAKVSAAEELRQEDSQTFNNIDEAEYAPLHPSSQELQSQIRKVRKAATAHRLDEAERAERDKKARLEDWQTVHHAHGQQQAESSDEVHHEYESDEATENNPFGSLAGLDKEELKQHRKERRQLKKEQKSRAAAGPHVLTYAEAAHHAPADEPAPEPAAQEHPVQPEHKAVSYAKVLLRPVSIEVPDPAVVAHQKEVEQYQWHQVDHAHAAHGIKELEAPLKPVLVDNPFVGLKVESPHPHAQAHHATVAKSNTNTPADDTKLDEGWQVVTNKRHHDVYLNHKDLPIESKEALQNPFGELTIEESEEAQAYKCILDEYLDIVEDHVPHDAARKDALLQIIKAKGLLMKRARHTTVARHNKEVRQEQKAENAAISAELARMDGEGAAISHSIPTGLEAPKQEDIAAARMDDEGGAAIRHIPAPTQTTSAQQTELEKGRMDAEGAAASTTVPVHVPTNVFVDSHHSFADIVKASADAKLAAHAETPAPAHSATDVFVDPHHSFAEVLKAGSAHV